MKAEAALLADSEEEADKAEEDEVEVPEFNLEDFMVEFNLIPGNEPIKIPEETKKERDYDYDLPYETPTFD